MLTVTVLDQSTEQNLNQNGFANHFEILLRWLDVGATVFDKPSSIKFGRPGSRLLRKQYYQIKEHADPPEFETVRDSVILLDLAQGMFHTTAMYSCKLTQHDSFIVMECVSNHSKGETES